MEKRTASAERTSDEQRIPLTGVVPTSQDLAELPFAVACGAGGGDAVGGSSSANVNLRRLRGPGLLPPIVLAGRGACVG